MAVTAGGLQGVVGGIGGAVGDFMSADASEVEAHGDFAAGASYLRAKDIAVQNETITQESTKIQQAQLGRQITMKTATGVAQVAGHGLQGGSSGDLMRMSMQQGSLAQAVLGQQGAINKNAFAQQAEGYQGMSDSAVAAGNAALKAAEAKNAGGVFNLIGAGVGLMGMMLL